MIKIRHFLRPLAVIVLSCTVFILLGIAAPTIRAAPTPQTGTPQTGVIASGVPWYDNNGNPVNAHGAGIIKVGNTYYMVGEARTTNNFSVQNEYETLFHATSCYSSQDLTHWTYIGDTLLPQSGTDIGPDRIVERPKILYNASTHQYVEFVHTADTSFNNDYLNYATSSSVCGTYTPQGRVYFQGTSNGVQVGDIGSFQDSDGSGYIVAAAGMIYKLTADYHSIAATVASSICNNCEGAVLFKAGRTYFSIFSSTTWWHSNDDFYYSATSPAGPWTWGGYLAPTGTKTWNAQSTFVLPVQGTSSTSYIFLADRWCDSCLTSSTYVWQPLTLSGQTLSLASFYPEWSIDVTTGTWATVTDNNTSINDSVTGNGQNQFSYNGTGWGYNACGSGDNCYNGDNHWDNTTNDSVTMRFTGTQVDLYAVVASNHGLAAVSICDTAGNNCSIETIIDLYAPNRSGNQLTWISPVKPYGSYMLKLRATGNKDYYSTDYYITLDRVTVESGTVNPYASYKRANP